MQFKIFSLYPQIFQSFLDTSLVARGIAKNIIEVKLIDWREKYGIGGYKQVDDKPFGGGSGMVLMADPIIQAMLEHDAINFDYSALGNEKNTVILSGAKDPLPIKNTLQNISPLTKGDVRRTEGFVSTEKFTPPTPNNSTFEKLIKQNRNNPKQSQIRKVNILTTPRGFPFDQKIAQWIASEFDEINILCGRFEGFDNRVNDYVDLELSMGNYVLNGGEVPAMAMVEAISRLVPEFITKDTSVLHDSFSQELNSYQEFEFDNSRENTKNRMNKIKGIKNSSVVEAASVSALTQNKKTQLNLFSNSYWIANILPHIEHPQYTRPLEWKGKIVPKVLISGDHAKIQKWRMRWW
jgi:tRNA (guanine37-N1)-methyltransferase